MSRLQNVILSLCEVIISYSESQSKTNKTYSREELLKKSHLDFMESLQTIINEGTTIYVTRVSLLNYFHFEINRLKPLLEQNAPLSQEDTLIMQQHLQALILNVNKLLNTSQSSTVTINYRKKSEDIPGFIRGMAKGWTLCNSGQIIQDGFIAPLGLLEYSEKTVANFIDCLIKEHQLEVGMPLLSRENGELKKEISTLKENNESLTEANLKLENDKQRMSEEIESLKLDTSTLKEEKGKLEKQYQDAHDEVERLRKEIALLKTSKPSLNFTSKKYYHPFWGMGINGLSAALLPGTINTTEQVEELDPEEKTTSSNPLFNPYSE
ncbi:hypothetical protein [Legionella brunensis]|uniref:Uncharacterized protein n=1 Tax=Legionella brunensis TaxID=29422 RepID=A0A0W0SLB4_9GAMM|nr:hypothetical protein [Legionella brunensis]KTC84150.1 hypothetical protein Lbru_1511 [Legionella brunensis]